MSTVPGRTGGRARLLSLLMVAAVACGAPSIEEIPGSVVRVEAEPCGRNGAGTGTVVGADLVLTNAHMVAGSTDDVRVRVAGDHLLEAVVVGFDPVRDLALLYVDGLGVDQVEIGDVERDSPVSIIGRPTSDGVALFDATVTRVITATGDNIYGEEGVSRRALELDADIEPGVSGAGVYDDDGRLAGVVFAESTRRDTTYAVTSDEVRSFLADAQPGTPADTLICR